MITTNNHMTYREPTPQDRQSLIDVLERQGYQEHVAVYCYGEYREIETYASPKNFRVLGETRRLTILHDACDGCYSQGVITHTKHVLSDILVTLGKLDREAIYHVQEGWGDRLYVYIPENMRVHVNQEDEMIPHIAKWIRELGHGYDFREMDRMTKMLIDDWTRETIMKFGEPL